MKKRAISFTNFSKIIKGRFDEEFIEQRRKGLEEFLNSVVNHPFSRFEKKLQEFLQDQDAKVHF